MGKIQKIEGVFRSLGEDDFLKAAGCYTNVVEKSAASAINHMSDEEIAHMISDYENGKLFERL